MMDPVPHFSIFGKNYTRRFRDTDISGQILAHVLGQCMDAGLADTSHIFVDAAHVKACADNKKMQEQAVHDEALWYEEELKKEIFLQKHILSDFPLYESIHAVVRDEATSVQIPNRKKPCEPLWKKPAHL